MKNISEMEKRLYKKFSNPVIEKDIDQICNIVYFEKIIKKED